MRIFEDNITYHTVVALCCLILWLVASAFYYRRYQLSITLLKPLLQLTSSSIRVYHTFTMKRKLHKIFISVFWIYVIQWTLILIVDSNQLKVNKSRSGKYQLQNSSLELNVNSFKRMTYWGFPTRVSGVSALSRLAVSAGQSPNPPWPGFYWYTHTEANIQ